LLLCHIILFTPKLRLHAPTSILMTHLHVYFPVLARLLQKKLSAGPLVARKFPVEILSILRTPHELVELRLGPR
jgi:hypothetical protein